MTWPSSVLLLQVGSGFTDLDRERLHNALKDNVCEHPPPCYE